MLPQLGQRDEDVVCFASLSPCTPARSNSRCVPNVEADGEANWARLPRGVERADLVPSVSALSGDLAKPLARLCWLRPAPDCSPIEAVPEAATLAPLAELISVSVLLVLCGRLAPAEALPTEMDPRSISSPAAASMPP